ncbi:NAD-dependent epimerase/dehydratase family protein [Agrobacterium vitis]|uniref:thioester reductase domain-containing protein n=1 Tax=Allorhizobium ampelinum TaxID=3025782 RepID=UPI001F2C0D7E|nr:thioester reductase domain-containing protein [Allorhizobium ampelinum]MCF1460122.1 NAD-dependent epimerase/dehydratase family protein [Allorhizobium ampelinum]
MSEKKNVFLTGATGFIGAYLLTEMLKSSHIGKIYTLCRRFDPQNDRDRILLSFKKFSIEMDRAYLFTDQIQVVEGDITMPRFGLSDSTYEMICQEADLIHHVAARVNHIQPYELLKKPNVDSMADAIIMASRGKQKIVNFVSTLGSAVTRDSIGNYLEDFPDNTALESDMGYLLSKWEGEKLQAKFIAEGGKTNLFRLGYISGHSTSGVSLFENNQFMLFVKSCIQLGHAPELDRTINFTPVDYTVKIMNSPKYTIEGGHVLNLFNFTGLIEWKNVVQWLNARGYEISIIPFYEWQKLLLSDGESNPLYSLLPLYGSDNAHEKILRFGREIHKYRYDNVCAATIENDVWPPRLKFELLDTYLSYLQSQEFLPAPTMMESCAA